MLSEEDIQEKWNMLQEMLTVKPGITPGLDLVLLFIGIRESGLPASKPFTEKEIIDLKQIALCTVLVPARYFELFWVDDTGWPHFRQLQRVPEMSETEKENFLKPHIIRYAEKSRLI